MRCFRHTRRPTLYWAVPESRRRRWRFQGLQRALDKPAPIDLSPGLIGDSPLCLITPQDSEYPPLLRECPDRPPFLFCRGVLPCLGAATLSIVGTRKPSLEGRRAAREFAAAAAASGLVVVSGLALGIDGIAHDAALTAGGSTVAVLPSGMDRIYPARHQRLAERVMAEGALVSEFPLGTPPRKHHFHRRNRRSNRARDVPHRDARADDGQDAEARAKEIVASARRARPQRRPSASKLAARAFQWMRGRSSRWGELFLFVMQRSETGR